jgi:trimeric autotransporter adhesin
VVAFAFSGSPLYIGGSFTTYRGVPAQHIAKLDLINGNLDATFTQATGLDNTVNSLDISGSSLYLGGSFTAYRGNPAPYRTSLDLVSGELTD